MKKLRVLMFGWEYAPLMTGGLGVVCKDMAESLTQKNVDIQFVLPKLAKKTDTKGVKILNSTSFFDPSISVHQIDTPLTPYMNNNQYTYAYKQATLQTDEMKALYGVNLLSEIMRYADNAKNIAQKLKFDVIHVHDWMTFSAGINAKKISGKPLVMHVHATEYDRSGGHPYPEILKMEKEGLKHADLIMAVSQRTKKQLVEKYDVPESKIQVVYNAINHKAKPVAKIKQPYAAEKVVLFLGRLSIQKGADFLLDAAKIVLDHMDEKVRFVFVGKGDMLAQLIHQSIDLGISKQVSFLGFLDHAEIDTAYRHADLFVMPSVSEPFGLTSLEAIKNGTPVLVSKQSGVAEVIPNTLKIDYWDTEDMADKILAVLKHKVLSKTLVSNGYYDLSKITWDTQSSKLIDIYQKLL